ncbi:UDP-N-acetylmuramate dehydrogenase [Rheinheimera pacifica]|uniref:UDP-N-acetylmuramate dehydrogenase n=1 Tax=Rheinheimera pacifica TaxID=173990 RepID=UPI00285DD8BA|nr:UDP-N-acetylmuramate dehydrogenase [Rheinheimera pacifica]MDR6985527.1 UDP-N-acetylmuramate dehydrogenase [Rheinheimera pacifica]
MRTLTNISAVPYSTFRFNATLSSLHEFSSVAELYSFDTATAPVVLGEGSNTIFMQDLTAPICRFVADSKIVTQLDPQHVLIHVEAGHNWHQLVSWTVEQQFWGIENLALIPGSVGAAPVQNIGAYGVELADSCLYVDFYHWQQRKVQRIAAGRCQFGYRDSVFKHALAGKGIIVAVGLCLSKSASPVLGYKGLDHLPADAAIATVFEQVIAVRSSKLPDPAVLANCGSFFKNPVIAMQQYTALKAKHAAIPGFIQADNTVKVPAAWLIEQQGFKGKNYGDVGCYKLQPLVVVNHGAGTPAQLEQLVTAVQQQVFAVYGIQLEAEVRMLNGAGQAVR